MKRLFVLLLLTLAPWLLISFTHVPETDKLGIRVNQSSILVFPDEIQSVHIDANSKKEVDYYTKIEGLSLIIRAKRPDAQPATLSVQYGKNKPYTVYGADIFPDEKAPTRWNIQPTGSAQFITLNPIQKNEQVLTSHTSVFDANEKQQYGWFAIDEGGITVMVTNIAHNGNDTHLRIYIDNRTTVNLKLTQGSFEYVTKLRKWLFFTTEQKNRVTPLLAPQNLEVAPGQFGYFDFSIPTYTSNGGLDVFLGESENGIRKYKINIPTKILLQAPRR